MSVASRPEASCPDYVMEEEAAATNGAGPTPQVHRTVDEVEDVDWGDEASTQDPCERERPAYESKPTPASNAFEKACVGGPDSSAGGRGVGKRTGGGRAAMDTKKSCMRPRRKANMRNLKFTKRVVWHAHKVSLSWRRRHSWKFWHLTFTGPEKELPEAEETGHDALENPDHYTAPPPQDHREIC